MLDADCVVLFKGFLWQKIVSYTWIHKDKKMLSTWMHVEGVEKFVYLTLNQAHRNVANTENNRFFKQSCRNSKTNTTT
jgi:hypothetical protein